ncbi:hypothetical protein ES705_36575 [subsurface metagenome]
MKILGIHDGHNASVCLLEDGHICSAIQEERLARIKNFMGFPSRAINAIFKSMGLSYSDIDLIAMHSRHMPMIINREQLLEEYRNSDTINMYLKRFVKVIVKKTFLKEPYLEHRRRARVQEILKQGFEYKKIIFVDHHLAHAAAAYYGTPWIGKEEILVLTNDAGGDESNAIGVDCQVYAEEMSKQFQEISISPLCDLYLGLEFKNDEVEDILKRKHLPYGRKNDIEKEIALHISQGEIVARFKGIMEFGARALGNRSILADPSNTSVIQIINEMIKNRDFWMPFAPSVLKERENDYVMNTKEINAPYMIICFDSTDKVDHLKLACHPYDNTVCPQIVEKDWSPDYYRLIKEFEKLTGIGAILNTSFNLHGYPIVCSPEDAIGVFLKSGLKYLALENFLVRK